MEYKREIDNDVMIQYIILFILATAKRHITYKQLSELIFDNCNIEFQNFQIALSNLEETEHIRSFSFDELTTVYELLPKGKDANKFFKSNIPIYIKEPLTDAIFKYFKEDAIKRSVRAELMPITKTEFAARCQIFDNSTPLLDLTLWAGTRDDANKMIKKFREKTEDIYKRIIDVMTEE